MAFWRAFLSFVAGVSKFRFLKKFLVGICLMSFYNGILWHFMIAFCVNILLEFVTGICWWHFGVAPYDVPLSQHRHHCSQILNKVLKTW
jgi:hypothetical protein